MRGAFTGGTGNTRDSLEEGGLTPTKVAATTTRNVMTPTTEREEMVTAAAGTRLRFRRAMEECTASTKDWPVKATIGSTKLQQHTNMQGNGKKK